MAFLAESGIELSDERLDAIAAGKLFGNSRISCPNNKEGHEWVFTGRTRPGSIWGGQMAGLREQVQVLRDAGMEVDQVAMPRPLAVPGTDWGVSPWRRRIAPSRRA